MGHPVHFYPYGEFVHTTSFNLFLIKSNKYLDMMSAGNLQTILGRSCGYQRMEVVSHVLLYLHKYHYIWSPFFLLYLSPGLSSLFLSYYVSLSLSIVLSLSLSLSFSRSLSLSLSLSLFSLSHSLSFFNSLRSSINHGSSYNNTNYNNSNNNFNSNNNRRYSNSRYYWINVISSN